MKPSTIKATSYAVSRGAVREEIQRQRDTLQADLDAAHWEAFGHCVPVEAD